ERWSCWSSSAWSPTPIWATVPPATTWRRRLITCTWSAPAAAGSPRSPRTRSRRWSPPWTRAMGSKRMWVISRFLAAAPPAGPVTAPGPVRPGPVGRSTVGPRTVARGTVARGTVAPARVDPAAAAPGWPRSLTRPRRLGRPHNLHGPHRLSRPHGLPRAQSLPRAHGLPRARSLSQPRSLTRPHSLVGMESPLLATPGAVPAEGPDTGVAAHYGDPFAEQRALARSAGVVDRSHHGVLRIT